MFELERRCGRTAGEEENRIGIVHLVGRFNVEGFKKNNSWSEDGIYKMDPLSCSAEPRAERGGVVHRLVVGMLEFMGHGCR